MKYLDWTEEKNDWLKKNRNISFEEIELLISQGETIEIIDNPNTGKYPNQKIFIININDYVWYVPFIEDSKKNIFKNCLFNPQRQ